MSWQDKARHKKRLKRRGFPIHGYVGPNGHGKSLAMVYDTLPSLDAGRPVLSTVRLLDFRNPRDCEGGARCDDPEGHALITRRVWFDEEAGQLRRAEVDSGRVHQAAHPFYVPFRDYRQLMSWRDGDVLMDEVTGVASSRESKNMPAPVANMLVQLRRRNIALRWTAPAWGRADVIMREVTQAVTLCLGYFPTRAKVEPGSPPQLWGQRRGFRFSTFDAALMDEFEAQRASDAEPEFSQLMWRPAGLATGAYDTGDDVSSLGWAMESGVCIGCGGRRSIQKCGCSDHGGTDSAAEHEAIALASEVEAAEVGPAWLPDLSIVRS